MYMFQRPRGTRDFGPSEMDRRRIVESSIRSVSAEFGFREIMTPTIEHLKLFTTKSGPAIIDETYSFKDKGHTQCGKDVHRPHAETAQTDEAVLLRALFQI
jgi:histidyl-tRNA synthetase